MLNIFGMSKLWMLSSKNLKNTFVFCSIIDEKLYLLVLFNKSKRSHNLEIATRIITAALYTSILYIIYRAMYIQTHFAFPLLGKIPKPLLV